jgi:hypothetical protein
MAGIITALGTEIHGAGMTLGAATPTIPIMDMVLLTATATIPLTTMAITMH